MYHKLATRWLLAALLGLGLVGGMQGSAQADTVNTLQLSNSITWGFKANVSLHGNSYSVNTGEMNVVLNGFQDVVAYCVELTQTINLGQTYYNVPVYSSSSSLSTLQAAWLLSSYATGLGNNNSSYSRIDEVTALQLAIWEVTYDYANTYASNALDSGYFILRNLSTSASGQSLSYGESSTIKNLALSYLASIPSNLASLGFSFGEVSRDPSHQDLIMSGSTPEPGSMLLLGSCLASLGFWRLRRRRQGVVSAT